MDTLTDADIEAWADGFIRTQAYNRPVAVQIAMEAAKFIRSRLSQAAAPSGDALDAELYARALAHSLWEKHYRESAPDWKALPDLLGVLTQIDNMTAPLAKPPQEIEATPPQVEPAEWISVDDERVPPFGTAVLAYLPGWPISILADGGDEQELRAVTHWMPLPAPPIAAASKPEAK